MLCKLEFANNSQKQKLNKCTLTDHSQSFYRFWYLLFLNFMLLFSSVDEQIIITTLFNVAINYIVLLVLKYF